MLDLVGILFSSIMMLLVIFRAIQMDVQLPWYRRPTIKTDGSGLRLRRQDDEAPQDEMTRNGNARRRVPSSR